MHVLCFEGRSGKVGLEVRGNKGGVEIDVRPVSRTLVLRLSDAYDRLALLERRRITKKGQTSKTPGRSKLKYLLRNALLLSCVSNRDI